MARRTLTTDEIAQLNRHGPVVQYGTLLSEIQEGFQNEEGSKIEVYNGTGGNLTAGTLLYVNGWDATNDIPSVAKADADSYATTAELVAWEDIPSTGTGDARGAGRLTSQNTAGLAEDTPLYLSSTAGTWTDTAPTGDGDVQQIIGYVAVQHASAGEVYVCPERRLVMNFTQTNAGSWTFDGDQPASVGTTPGTAGGALIAATGKTGGNTTIATTGVGGGGGTIALTSGTGGVASAAATSATGGNGGTIAFTGGTGGAAGVAGAGDGTGGNGGAASLVGGTGGNVTTSTGTNLGGTGGAANVTGGTGGNATAGTDTGGAGGAASLSGGTGGNGDTGGVGGSVYVVGGAAGTGGSPAAGNVVLGGTSGGSYRGDVQVGGVPAASATRALLRIGTTAIAGGSASGTFLGMNAAATFAGNLLDVQQNGTTILNVVSLNAAVNGLSLRAAATGNAPTLIATGSDANVGLIVQPKGTGTLTVSGTQPSAVGTTPGTSGGTFLTVTGRQGGETSIATTGTGGQGASIGITAGAGGSATAAVTAATGGAGGAVTVASGQGADSSVAGAGDGTGGDGGAVTVQTGDGGVANTATGTNLGGSGGLLSILGGAGGAAQDGTDTGGAGADIHVYAGAGGAGDTGGVGGGVYVVGGAAGAGGAPAAGNVVLGGTQAGSYRGDVQVGGVPAASATRALLRIGTTAVSGGSASGTYLGLNAGATFAGNLVDLQQNGAALLRVLSVNAAVNGASLQAAATGNAPTLAAIGSDANVGLTVQPKGTGTLLVNGTQPAAVGTTPGTTGGTFLTVTGRQGGNTTIATTGVGGEGATVGITAGAGGTADAAVTAATGGAGGGLTLSAGGGAAAAATGAGDGTGGEGGTLTLNGGVGGAVTASTGTNLGGAGGGITLLAGVGGAAQDGTDTGGAGGNVSITAGAGGNSDTGGAGGSVTITAGAVGTGGSPTTGSVVARTSVNIGSTVKLQARDVDGAAYDDVVTITAGNTPTLALAADGGITVTQQLQTGANLGAAGVGVTAVEYGEGTIHQTVLTLTLTGANDLDIADGADGGDSHAIYTFPEGRILVLGVTCDLSCTVNNVFEATPNDTYQVGIGSVAAAMDATLAGTEQDLIPVQTNDTASSTALTHAFDSALAASAQFDGTAAAVVAYVNAAVANASISAGLTVAVTGTVRITWIMLGDY